MRLSKLVQDINYTGRADDRDISYITHDSRKVKQGTLFIAFKGIKSDGHGEFGPSKSELPEREWRSDPIDGLRPLKDIRNSFEK